MDHEKQLIIPKVYLKHFATTNNKVKVIQLSNPHRRNIQEKGIGDQIFCDYEKRYYDFPNKRNEHVLEKMFGQIENEDYETIMSSVNSNEDLGYETKKKIINWTTMTKMRSSYFRDTFSSNIAWAEKTKSRLKSKSQISKEEEKNIEDKSKNIAKGIHLFSFFDNHNEILKEYFANFMCKDWSILKSTSSYFITSDNAGFSVSLSFDNFLRGNSVSSMYNLDRVNPIIPYFPLSKEYTLCLFPLSQESIRKDVEDLKHTSIKIETVGNDKIYLINEMTIQSSYKLIIASESVDLENMLDLIKKRFH